MRAPRERMKSEECSMEEGKKKDSKGEKIIDWKKYT